MHSDGQQQGSSWAGAPGATSTELQALVHELQAQLAKARFQSESLDERVRERTVDLMQTVGDLQAEVAQRRAAEEKLREQQEFSRQLIDNAHAIILVLDLDGRIVMFNKFLEELTGYTLDEVKGRAWLELMVPMRQESRVGALFQKAIGGQRTKGNVNAILTKDGQEILTEWYDAPLTDETGKQIALLCLGQDITERVQAEQEQAQLAAIVHSSNDAIIRATLDGTIENWNEAAERMYGYTAQEAIGESILMLVPPGRASEVHDILKRVEAGEKIDHFETVRVCKEGRPIDVSLSISPIRDVAGQVVAVSAIARDITEKNQMQRSLKEREERLRAVLNTAVDAIITIDERGVITGVNPATERMFGYSESEMVGQNVKMLMPSPYREEHDQYIANYLRTGRAKIIGIGREVVGRRKDGTTFPVDLAVSQVDHMREFTGIIRDISERKELEEHLAEAREEEQRHIARELHDGLGGQVTGIALLATALQEQLKRVGLAEADRAAELVQHIRDAHEQLRRLSRGLQPVDITPIGLQAALGDLAERSVSDRLTCTFACDGEVTVHAPTHATHLYRIAQEAVSNAVRHGGCSRITIRLAERNGVVTLSVTDNGAGIQENPDGHGGMGLRTMQYRATQIGGVLSVNKPNEGGGTVVTCIYPNNVKGESSSSAAPPTRRA